MIIAPSSFFWDCVMDWGLFQQNLPNDRKCLRKTLLYHTPVKYYVAIVVDLGLRILWVTKWWESWRGLGADFKFIAECCEVMRRVGWNCFRIEWQVLKQEKTNVNTNCAF